LSPQLTSILVDRADTVSLEINDEDAGVSTPPPGQFLQSNKCIRIIANILNIVIYPTISRNPPVTIEDWPEPAPDEPDDSDIGDDVPANDPNQDPPFTEPTNPPTLDPDFEVEFNDEELHKLLELQLGTLDEDEWRGLC
jgi:hypothetical protein